MQAVFVGSGTSRLTEPRLLGRSIHLWSMKYSITRLWSMEATVRSTQYGETNVLHCAAGLSSQTYQRFQMHGKAPRPITWGNGVDFPPLSLTSVYLFADSGPAWRLETLKAEFGINFDTLPSVVVVLLH